MSPKLLTILTLFVLATIFIIQNTDVVELRFLFWKIDMSRSLMFLFLMLVGTGTGWFLRGHMLRKRDTRNDVDESHN
ncbi:lipopolysaccharide assembly protein LapA domain-containing protein [Mariprofundus ferrooxydans]|uniref:Lipopolysaccharide assembly protein A domain-containing protein n=1 Tax=Mariprofundus ferrooxydans PV-1 TaxID=314345 RepID=Q0F0V6_9PROT|nr:LapA family protein [Mariprofundus ferrooxydans]EAU55435.1 hypothetical protein SPV1_11901 [Mariprofundus ferrooxydans PV-1]KON47653.1 hypothetical protein AL013_06680 [Mariprofundus ferrooxydans]